MNQFMTTTTATATKKPRRARRRKPASPASKATVTTTTYKGGAIVKQETEIVKRPSDAALISMDMYRKDFTQRWNIHLYEWQEFVKDAKALFTYSKTKVIALYDRIKSVELN